MNLGEIFFLGWGPIVRTIIVVILAYTAMVLLLRISGKRTFARMTAFDMIVPLTLGPILASTILLPNVSLVHGMVAFASLITLHTILAWLTARFTWLRTIVKPEPALLVYQGQLIRMTMRKERVTEREIHEIIRDHGLASVEEVEAVVLEADGAYNVIQRLQGKGASSLEILAGYPPVEGV
jgi:uncharacterized membrane protein YcaP (DUF421 family)